MITPRNAYSVVYRVTGRPEVEADFPTEHAMEEYCIIYLDYPDLDYVNFFRYNVEYTPDFWKEWQQ